MKIISRLLFFAGISYYIFHFLFFWVFESTDSYFYWALSNFFRTGQYFAPAPYYYSVPSTMEPPLYSAFLFFAQVFPRADIIIHAVQILSIVASAILIFKIFEKYAKKDLAMIIAATFLLAPAHTIYISNLVAEPVAVFFITFYVYLLQKIISEKKARLIPFLLVFSAIAALQRYNLIVFYGFILVFLIFRFLLPSPRRNTLHTPGVFLGFLVSVVILFSWVIINNRLNGSWGMSNSEGKHLYNRIFHFDRMLPPETEPSFVKFKSIVGDGIDYFKPWWFYEPQLIKALGSETAGSKLMEEVSLAALRNNPVKYFADTIPFFFFTHGSNPTYHDPLYLYNGNMKKDCRTLGSITFCRPLVDAKFAYMFWDKLVTAIDAYYLYVSQYINYFLLFPAIIFTLFKKDGFMKSVAVLYLFSIIFFIMTEAAIPRYTYIFTPVKTILIGYFLMSLVCPKGATYEKRSLDR